MKFDTSKDRRNVVKNLFKRAARVDDGFRRDPSRISFGDILGLMVMMEKLTALEDLITIEMILEGSLCDMLDVDDESEATRQKFVKIFGDGVENFLKHGLLDRLDNMINFANNNFGDRRLVKFQTEFRETLTTLREKYHEVYGF